MLGRVSRSFNCVRGGAIRDVDEFMDLPLESPGTIRSDVQHVEASARTALVAAKRASKGPRNDLPKLHRSASQDDVESLVCELVLKGVDVNERTRLTDGDGDTVDGVTALHLAAQAGHREVCRMLLRRGADPRVRSVVVRTGASFTPADSALAHGNVRVWWLLSRAARRYDRLRRPMGLPPLAEAFSVSAE